MGNKFAPDFGKFLRNLCIISTMILTIGLCIYLSSENDSCLYYMGAIVVGTFGLMLQYYLANVFYRIAADKGYTDSKYFYITFWLGWIGYLMVVALPDLKLRALIEGQKKNNVLPQPKKKASTTEKVGPSRIQEDRDILGDNHKIYFTPTTPREHFECALTYTDDPGVRGYLNMVMDYPEMKDYSNTIRGLMMLSKGQIRSALMDILDSMR